MTVQRFQDIKRVFGRIIDAPRENRSTLLDELCGADLELREQVSRLLIEEDKFAETWAVPTEELRGAALMRRALARAIKAGFDSKTGPKYPASGPRAMSGRIVSHYEIGDRIAEGGMGVLYKAKDTKLDRIVAVKFLVASLMSDEESRQRFVREAKAAAALNHPNICTVHEIGEIGEDLFIVMELIEGQDLAELIRSGPLRVDDAVQIVIEAGEGLQAAHERGIVHRDVKSSNIMVTPQNRVKVLDFGLAQFDRVQLTEFSSLLGTPGYMSPEQLQGMGPPGAGADIWSLGVVLYEIVAGQLPFHEDYADALKYSIIHEPPVPLSTIRPEIPYALEAIVGRALQKKESERYGSIRQMILDLQSLRDGHAPVGSRRHDPGQPPFRAVAVLPFVNMSPDQENEYFTDGLTEEITNALTQIGGLRVVSRGSAFQFRGTTRDIRKVSERLHVNAVVDGSVRVAGGRLRVTAQLISAPDGYQIWSQKFDRAKADVFDLQDELTNKILESLTPRLAESTQESIVKRYTKNLEAHEFYLQGRYLLNQQTEAGARQAAKRFQQAIASSANYPLPHVGLAESYLLLAWYGLDRADDLIPNAKKAIEQALRLDAELAAAHCVMGIIRAGYEWDWENAERAFLSALALGPGFSTSHFHYAMDYLTPMGRLDAALAEIRMALQFDPLSLIVGTAAGGCLYRQRNYDAAVDSLEETLTNDSSFYHAHWTLGKAYEQTGDFDKALAALLRAKDLEESNPSIWADLGHCYGKSGQKNKAISILDALDEQARRRYVSPLCQAVVHLGLGNVAQTLEWIEKAFQQRTRSLVWLNVDPRFDPVRPERAFRAITERIGLPAGP